MIDRPGPDPDNTRPRRPRRPATANHRVPGKIITAADIAELLGLSSAATARSEIARWRRRTETPLTPIGRDVSTGAALYWIGDVEATVRAARPGRGMRTDLKKKQQQQHPPDPGGGAN